MPAAAVIPTPRVSMMDAAVKESVVVNAGKYCRLRIILLQEDSGAERGRSMRGREMK